MPRATKRRRQLQVARQLKHRKMEQSAQETPVETAHNSFFLLEDIHDYVSDNDVDYQPLNEELDEEALIHNHA